MRPQAAWAPQATWSPQRQQPMWAPHQRPQGRSAGPLVVLGVIALVLVLTVALALIETRSAFVEDPDYLADKAAAIEAYEELIDRAGSNRVLNMQITSGYISVDVFRDGQQVSVATYTDEVSTDELRWSSYGVPLDGAKLDQIMTELAKDAEACQPEERIYFVRGIAFEDGEAFTTCPESPEYRYNVTDPNLARWEPIYNDSAEALAANIARITRGAPGTASEAVFSNLDGGMTAAIDYPLENGRMTVRTSDDDPLDSYSDDFVADRTFYVADLDAAKIFACGAQLATAKGSDGWFVHVRPNYDGTPAFGWQLTAGWGAAEDGITDINCQPVEFR